jgi:hypothetical protein
MAARMASRFQDLHLGNKISRNSAGQARIGVRNDINSDLGTVRFFPFLLCLWCSFLPSAGAWDRFVSFSFGDRALIIASVKQFSEGLGCGENKRNERSKELVIFDIASIWQKKHKYQ